jgi:triacylglycerol lipase
VLRLVANEAASTLRCALHSLEGFRPPTPMLQPKPLPRVLLVHGFMGSPKMFYPMARHLLSQGVPEVRFAAYPSTTYRLEQIIDHLESTVGEDTEVPWNMVGHSVGAVAIRAWLKQRNSAPPVDRFVALGAPFHGTQWHFVAPKNLKEALDPQANWVQQLNEGPEPPGFQIIRARHDQNVRPSHSASLPGVEETILDHVGHNGLINHPKAIRAVWRALSQGRGV